MTDRHRLIEALRDLDGVADAEIVDDERGVGTLRLTLVPGADEVAVAVAVNGVLGERFNLAVDSGRVQVVEETWSGGLPPAPSVEEPSISAGLSAPAGGSAYPPVQPSSTAAVSALGARRMAIRRLQLVSTTTGISTAVSLGLGLRTFVGEAEAGAAPDSVQEAVARATLRAVSDVVGDRTLLELEAVEVTSVGDDRVAVVVVHAQVDDAPRERLTGASVVRGDVRQAVLRATLDAVNRRVEAQLASLDDPA